MTRTSHFPTDAHIPVYSVDFLSDNVVVYAGGGGAGRSGVTNAIVAAHISTSDQSTTKLHELKLSRQEDAPMTMAVNSKRRQLVCGINSTPDDIKHGTNRHLRIFDWSLSSPDDDDKATGKQSQNQSQQPKAEGKITELPSVTIHQAKAESSLAITDPEQYQKVTRFSHSGRLLAVASTDGKIALQRYPSLAHVWKTSTDETNATLAASTSGSASATDPGSSTTGVPSQDFKDDEIYDADFSETGSHIVFTSSSKLVVYSTTPRATPDTPQGGSSPQQRPQLDGDGDGDGDDDDDSAADEPGYAQVIQTIKNPALGGKGPCSFRAARFGRGDASRERLFTVVNAAPAGGRGPKAKIRKSFVTAWDADSWDLIETRHVSDRPVTVFDVSPDGRLLAYGSSDLSVGVLDAKTLRPLVKILHAHDFPPTTLRFNPSSTLLVSASADNTLRIIQVPTPGSSAGGGGGMGGVEALIQARGGVYLSILLALIAIVLALVAQKRF
ncbi:uncharacterized protein PFL1_01833 [Pseudozyma flocculosa PF-1]|uniref:Uncharacterized protein n=1 Tax=Pseudozyma flocculosa TaxID=84751 RepID=A0A5C3EZ30_9BASI|nr:uncharacterized protein PFL1_01833 [Pseudozyma flocculosa PF-1]EPQ30935.1 hypothetical protein PFL1_01833 [Pseudozyma flocculosa PF-1]SPO36677.1 uncharacterized protein PSFLO_02148 [Pseudozyma flocculosa]